MALTHALAIAGLMVASTAAFAETLSAKIDFPFRAGSTAYPAAAYNVYIDSMNGVITVSNPATKVSHMFVPSPGDTHVKVNEPKLVFNCAQNNACSLAQVQSPRGIRWTIRQPKRTAAELERMAVVVVPLHSVKAD
jgi:hypothetical protein